MAEYAFFLGCGRTFQESSGSFQSPQFGSVNPSEQPEKCEWRITATHGERIVLNVTDLDMHQSDDCRLDYLEVRDGYWVKSPLIGQYKYENLVKILIRTLILF
jgi:tolkin